MWILVEVHIVKRHEQYKYADRTEQVAYAKTAMIKQSTPEEVCRLAKTTVHDMWQALGDAIKNWETHRKHLLATASYLARVVEAEETLLQVIRNKK